MASFQVVFPEALAILVGFQIQRQCWGVDLNICLPYMLPDTWALARQRRQVLTIIHKHFLLQNAAFNADTAAAAGKSLPVVSFFSLDTA